MIKYRKLLPIVMLFMFTFIQEATAAEPEDYTIDSDTMLVTVVLKHQQDKSLSELQKKMEQAGIKGQRLDMETGTGLIYSNKNKVISTNGTHSAIKVNDKVFDNLNPNGVKYKDWIDDLGGKEFTKPPHAKIKEESF